MKTYEGLPGTTIFQIAVIRDFVRNIQDAEDLEQAKTAGGEISRQLDVLLGQAEAAVKELSDA